jgi:hypothetical protein
MTTTNIRDFYDPRDALPLERAMRTLKIIYPLNHLQPRTEESNSQLAYSNEGPFSG